MPGICEAVKAATRASGSARNTVLKSWKSRPPAPMITTVRIATPRGRNLVPVSPAGAARPSGRALTSASGRPHRRRDIFAPEARRLGHGGRYVIPSLVVLLLAGLVLFALYSVGSVQLTGGIGELVSGALFRI